MTQPFDSDLTPGPLPWVMSAVAVVFFLVLMAAVTSTTDHAISNDNGSSDSESMPAKGDSPNETAR